MPARESEAVKKVEQRYSAEIDRLRDELDRSRTHGRALIAEAEAHAASFRLATGPLFSFDLLGPELRGSSRGRVVEAIAENARAAFRFGFDEEGGLLFVDKKHGRPDGEIEILRLGTTHRVNKLNGRVEGTGANIEAPDRRSEIRVSSAPARWMITEHFGASSAAFTVVQTIATGQQRNFRVERDRHGEIASITSVELGGIVWRRKSAPSNEKLAWFRDELIEQLHRRVPEAAGEREIYAVALAYCGSGDVPILPPELALGFVDERDRLLEAEPKFGVDAIWDPRQMFGPMREEDVPALILDDEALLREANEIDFHDDEVAALAEQTLVDIAAALNASGFAGVNLAPDFVVYAADLDRGDWPTDIERSAGKKRVAALRRGGLV